MTGAPVSCAVFEAGADDLALGFTSEPQRARLLEHAAKCASCGSLLRALSTTVDRMLELAPELEPAVGFETRAVAAMGHGSAGVRGPAPQLRSRPQRWRPHAVAAAAAVAVIILIAGVTGFAIGGGGGTAPGSEGEILSRSGAPLGAIELASDGTPRVVVMFDDDRAWPGVWTCELRRPDGTWVAVGSWTSAEASGGVWATRVDKAVTDAVAMRITAGNGVVIATADLS